MMIRYFMGLRHPVVKLSSFGECLPPDFARGVVVDLVRTQGYCEREVEILALTQATDVDLFSLTRSTTATHVPLAECFIHLLMLREGYIYICIYIYIHMYIYVYICIDI